MQCKLCCRNKKVQEVYLIIKIKSNGSNLYTSQNMPIYGFSLTIIFPHKDSIEKSVLYGKRRVKENQLYGIFYKMMMFLQQTGEILIKLFRNLTKVYNTLLLWNLFRYSGVLFEILLKHCPAKQNF